MQESLLSFSRQVYHVERLQSYHIKLMEHYEENAYTLIKKISQIIATGQVSSNVLLTEIALQLGSKFKSDYCCLVAINDESKNQLISTNWFRESNLSLLTSEEIRLVEKFLANLTLAQTVDNPLTENIAQNCHGFMHEHLPLQLKSLLAISTNFQGLINGAVGLMKFQAYEWDESEKQLLKAVEPSCAIAFDRVVQMQMPTLRQYGRKDDQYQSLIQQLTLLNSSNLELNQMLQLVMNATAESLEVDRGLLILFKYTKPLFNNPKNNPKNQIPQAKATVVAEWHREGHFSSLEKSENSNLFGNSLDRSFILSDCSLCRRIFTDSDKLIILDQTSPNNQQEYPAPLLATKEFSSTLLMSLENQGTILGIVVLQQKLGRNWQPSELNMIELVCAQLSNFIIQSQTLKQVQTLVDERTEQLRRSLEVQARLYERTKLYVEQLQELNELKDEFVSNISDRLRYPLTNMRMSIRNLRLPGVSEERQGRYLDILESECTKEINLINDLLTLQKLESDQESAEYKTVDLTARIRQIVTDLHKNMLNSGLTISLDLPEEPLQIQTELASLDRILQELLTNACKYSEYGTNIDFQVIHRVTELPAQVMIKVTNIGQGISPTETAYVFDKFRRGKGRWTPGTGLGLALVKSLVQHLHGAIAVESNPIVNSSLSEICFTLTLPQVFVRE